MWYSEIRKKYSERTLAFLDSFLVGKEVQDDINSYTGRYDIFVPTNTVVMFETNFAREIPLEERIFPPR